MRDHYTERESITVDESWQPVLPDEPQPAPTEDELIQFAARQMAAGMRSDPKPEVDTTPRVWDVRLRDDDVSVYSTIYVIATSVDEAMSLANQIAHHPDTHFDPDIWVEFAQPLAEHNEVDDVDVVVDHDLEINVGELEPVDPIKLAHSLAELRAF